MVGVVMPLKLVNINNRGLCFQGEPVMKHLPEPQLEKHLSSECYAKVEPHWNWEDKRPGPGKPKQQWERKFTFSSEPQLQRDKKLLSESQRTDANDFSFVSLSISDLLSKTLKIVLERLLVFDISHVHSFFKRLCKLPVTATCFSSH